MKEINIAKGLAMLSILYIHLAIANRASIGHCVLAHQQFGVNNLGGFILPMFFIIAGFSYAKTKRSIGNEIKQKVLNLFLYFLKYFVCVGVLFSFVEVIKGKYSVIECLRALLGEFLTRSTCNAISPNLYYKINFHNIYAVVWYVWAYLFAMLFFILITKIQTQSLKAELYILAGTGAVSLVVYTFLPELPFELNVVPSMVFLMYAAQLVKKYKLYQKFLGLEPRYGTIILLVAVFVGFWGLSFGSVGWMSHGTFSSPFKVEGMESLSKWAVWFLTMTGSFLMSFGIIYVCRFVNKIPIIGNFIAYIGVNSLDTMLLHGFFAMSICDIFGLSCGRNLTADDVMTPGLRLQCYFIFVITVVLCYFWPKAKMAVIKKVKFKNSR